MDSNNEHGGVRAGGVPDTQVSRYFSARGGTFWKHRSKAPTLQPEFWLTLQPVAFIRPYVSYVQIENAFTTYGLFLALKKYVGQVKWHTRRRRRLAKFGY